MKWVVLSVLAVLLPMKPRAEGVAKVVDGGCFLESPKCIEVARRVVELESKNADLTEKLSRAAEPQVPFTSAVLLAVIALGTGVVIGRTMGMVRWP